MGRQPEDLISRTEALKLLGVGKNTLAKMVRNGELDQYYLTREDGKRATGYSREQIECRADLAEKGIDLASLASMTLGDKARIRVLERKVDDLLTLFGLNHEELPTEEEEVLALYLEAKNKSFERFPGKDVVARWCRILYGFTEQYLAVLEFHTKNDEPWHPFWRIATQLLRLFPRGVAEFEYYRGFLLSALQHLRNTIYVYVCRRNGPKTAGKIFPETADRTPVDDLYRFLLLD